MHQKQKQRRSGVWLLAVWLACVLMGVAHERPLPERPAGRDEPAQLARAQTLLKQARAALGGEEAWRRLQSLSVRLRVERTIKYASVQGPDKVVEKERDLSGKVELEFLLPERFRRKVSTETLGIFNLSFAEIVNGDKAWRDPPLQVRPAQGDSRVIDVSDVERTLNRQTQGVQQQVSLYTLMYLLLTPASVPITWRAEGIFPITDQALGQGEKKVEVLLGIATDNFRPLLLLDPETHLPVGLSIVYVEAIRQNVLVEVAALDRGYLRRTYQRASQERRARTKPARLHEMRWLLSDYREINGLRFPHHIAITRDGELLEEMALTRLALNRSINPKRFEGEPRVKY